MPSNRDRLCFLTVNAVSTMAAKHIPQASTSSRRIRLVSPVVTAVLLISSLLVFSEQVAQNLEKAVVMICHTRAEFSNTLGSGCIISKNGRILTADHVIYDERTKAPHSILFAIYHTGQKHRFIRLRVERRFRSEQHGRDLALLTPAVALDIELPYMTVSDSAPESGDEVLRRLCKIT